jgi:oxygen-dependent protoporphyrinogen oxidase
VALACEAHASARLAASIDPALGEQLAGIPYRSATVAALGFAASSFRKPLQGFGFLVPRRERRAITACTFVGTKFAFRVPEGKVLLRCFVNESTKVNDASLIQNVLEELKETVGLTEAPLFSRIYRWPLSMAQYIVGREKRLQAMEVRLSQHPKLHLTGNAYTGIGIPDCIRTSRTLTEGIVSTKGIVS